MARQNADVRCTRTVNLEKSVRKLIVAEQISLDGVNQSPGAPNEDPRAPEASRKSQ